LYKVKQTHIIAILNQKGGVGKTTTAINIAAYLAKQKKRVLVVDADPQGNATSGLGLDKASLDLTLCDMLISESDPTKIVQPTTAKDVYILPTDARLASVEVDLAQTKEREYYLKKTLQPLLGEYDYILIDCPPALGLLTINALTAANYVFIPVQSEYYALEGLSQLLQVMQRVRAGSNPDLELLGVLMTMYDKRTTLAEQVYNEVQKHFGEKLFKTVIPRNIRLAEAPSYGKPISEHDKWSKGARAYKQVAKELAQHVEASE
jgi:chromosome partitioning protein